MNLKQKITDFARNNSKNLFLGFLFLLIIFLYAWLSDDAYITFRTVDNFVNGYGLTWNISERVQSFTHPLWTLVLSAFYVLTGEIYYTSLILSLIISLTAVLLILYRLSDSYYNSLLIILILMLSKSFIDYSTSGLENPLTHLILVIFFIVHFRHKGGEKKLLILSFLASLAALNRLDIILVMIPILVYNFFQYKNFKGLLLILLGFIPLILWELFSLLYYGFLFTNTAYAKLNTGIAEFQLIDQGLNYILYSIYFDPITPFIILIGLIYPIFLREKKLLLISAGIFLYSVYIIYIGGDFMGGRFLSAPLLCSIIIISPIKIKSKKIFALQITLVIMIGLLASNPPSLPFLHTSAGAKIFKMLKININQSHGIVDERDIYFKNTGLINNINQRQLLNFWMIDSALMVRKSGKSVVVQGVIGMFGYYCGPKIHIIDTLALSDPLLSKLPCDRRALPFDDSHPFDSRRWRIGHFKRSVPIGYIQTIQTGINQIEDPDLRKYYDKLHVLIRADVWDINRLKEIWNFNIGSYNYLLKNYAVNLKRKII